MSNTETKPTIVFIHGLWMNPQSWQGWMDRFEAAGYPVLAPAWPGFDRSVESLNANPGSIGAVTIAQILDSYERIIRSIEGDVVLVGHSFGGAFVQVLLDRGLGIAGVAVDSGPVKGVLGLPRTTLKSASPVLGNPFNWGKAVALDAKQFNYAFTNTLDAAESEKVWKKLAVPAASKVLFQGALANFQPRSALKVNFLNPDRGALLFIAGGDDHVAPASLNTENFGRYAKSTAITEYKEFAGRTHNTVGQDGWEEVADFVQEWVSRQSSKIVAARA
jgi:pimeloyl-ACP methyl ester carboxylesterase